MKAFRSLIIYARPYWRLALGALILLAAVVMMDLAIPRLIQRIVDQGIAPRNASVILQTSLAMLGISALSTVFAIGNNYLSVRVGESLARDLREAQFRQIQAFSHGNLDRFTTGQVMVRLTSDTAAFQRLVQVLLRIGTRAPLIMVGSLILMVNTNAHLALTMLPLLLVTTAVIVYFSVKMEPLFERVQYKLDALNTVLQEDIAGIRLIKAFGRANFEKSRFDQANQAFTGESIRVMQFMSAMGPILTALVNVGVVVVIAAGGLEVMRGELSLGQIIAFTNYMLTTMTPLTMMTMLSNVWANGLASAARIREILAAVPDVQAVPVPRGWPAAASGRVEFENAAFHYNGRRDLPALENVSLSAEPGQTIAILGATGAGKSSLINLIPRFYDVTSGQVCVDGVDVRELAPDALLERVAVVPQETVLFSGTVADNIRFGRPGASDEEVVAAARAAQAHDFIEQLPQGYGTSVAERGVNLSGGQKQRLAIARALLADPLILILDDSTSAVDVETETKIQAALDAAARPPTRFVVAQRISTVLHADKILVVDKGRIVAQGTHAELMQTSPIYQEIYATQLGAGVPTA
ncbi:MAG: ABC transporter ATP-binding protein [Anaerolineales bacterium]|nr:ABC transporter ATP-binding protein [Anaerolineales bacterium]